MPTLTICRGLSGSGKSTWAREQNAIVVSRDDLREALFGDYETYFKVDKDTLSAREDYITKVEHEAIGRALAHGLDVISDNTNIQMSYVNAIAKIGYRYDADVVVNVFNTPLSECIRRARIRASTGGRDIPNSVIEKQAERFKPGAKIAERPIVRPYNGTPGKPKAFMVDIDGTLADMKDYRGPYDLNVEVDEPRMAVINAVNSLADAGLFVICMSGRKEDCREATEEWLNKHNVCYDYLFMRKSDDNRADNLVKADLFDEFVRDNLDVQFVFDDRDQVVDMWRRMGLDCFQVAEGEF